MTETEFYTNYDGSPVTVSVDKHTVRLTQEPYPSYRSEMANPENWAEANGLDENGAECFVIWWVPDEALNDSEEWEGVDWENPMEIHYY